MKKIFKYGLAFIKNNKILLCKPFAFEQLILPGGIKEGKENHISCLKREITEELGSKAVLDINSLMYLGNFVNSAAGRKNTLVEIELYLGKVNGHIKSSSEIKELIWFSAIGKKDVLSPIIKNNILPELINKGYLS